MGSTSSFRQLIGQVSGQHGLIRTLLDDVTVHDVAQRDAALLRLETQLAAHEAWEQGWIHPLVAAELALGHGRPGDVDERLIEEKDAGDVLDRLWTMGAESFEVQFALLKEGISHHAHDEEERELPLLAEPQQVDAAAALARAVWAGAEVGGVAAHLLELGTGQRFTHLIALGRSALAERSGIPSASQSSTPSP